MSQLATGRLAEHLRQETMIHRAMDDLNVSAAVAVALETLARTRGRERGAVGHLGRAEVTLLLARARLRAAQGIDHAPALVSYMPTIGTGSAR